MFKNIRNVITRLAMDQLGRNLAGSAKMRLPWQRPLLSNGALEFSSYGRLEAEGVNRFY